MKQILFSSFSSVLLNLVSLLLLIVTAHSFGATGRGVYSAAIAVVTMLATVAGFSHGRVINYEIIQAKEAAAEFVQNNLATVLALIATISLIGALVAYILYQFNPHMFGAVAPRYLVVVFLSLPYFLWQGYQVNIFAAVDQITALNRLVIFNKILFLLCVLFILYVLHVSFFCFMIVYSLFNLNQLALELACLIHKNGIRRNINFGLVRRLFSNGAKMHFDTMGALCSSTANTLLVNYYLSSTDVGQFSFAVQALQFMMILPIAVNWYVSSKIAALGPDRAWPEQKKMIKVTLFVLAAEATVAYFIMPILMRVVNPEFISAGAYFKSLLLTLGGNAMITLIAPQWTARGYFFLTSCITIVIGILELLISFYAIPRYGVWGAVYSTLIYFFCFLVIEILFVLHVERKARQGLLPQVQGEARIAFDSAPATAGRCSPNPVCQQRGESDGNTRRSIL